jgi:hypothetical protein
MYAIAGHRGYKFRTLESLPVVKGEDDLTGAVRQKVAKKALCRILPCRSLSFNPLHNSYKLFRVVFLFLLLFLVFQIVVYDSNFTNNDPPFRVSNSWIVLAYHRIPTRLIKYFGEGIRLPITDKFDLPSRAPPIV